MHNHALFRRPVDPPLTVALVGVGEFGASFMFRSGRAPGLRVVAGADAHMARVIAAARAAGIDEDRIRSCSTHGQAKQALSDGCFAAVEDASLLMDLPVDWVVEATGVPEAAARIAQQAIDHGKNVGMVTKECDCVVGPALQARARAAGVVCTMVDGDQPSLAIRLIAWARSLGLAIVCAGKSSEYDFIYDPDARTISALGRTLTVSPLQHHWHVDSAALPDSIAARRALLASWPHSTVPDLCELALIANATGMKPDTPALHAPVARTRELPDVLRPQAEGGILARSGVLEIFNCLRRADEASFAGGVFVVVRCDDEASWRVLGGKGIPMSSDGRLAMLHNPIHLLGIEAPATLFDVASRGQPSAWLRPVCDLYGRAIRSLRAGEVLSLGERHAISGVEPMLLDAAPLQPDVPIPYYLAAGCKLAADVAPGHMVCLKDVHVPRESTLWELRRAQDQSHFE